MFSDGIGFLILDGNGIKRFVGSVFILGLKLNMICKEYKRICKIKQKLVLKKFQREFEGRKLTSKDRFRLNYYTYLMNKHEMKLYRPTFIKMDKKIREQEFILDYMKPYYEKIKKTISL